MINMIHAESFINQPAYEYIREDVVAEALAAHAKKQDERNGYKYVPIRYHNRNQTEEEKEVLTIAGTFDEMKNLKDLGTLLREGKIKEFYKIGNKVLMVKRNHQLSRRSKVRRPVAILIFRRKSPRGASNR